MIQLTFWGAAQTVTGSKHLLDLPSGQRLLLDCGLFQGPRDESERRNQHFGFDAASIDAVVLSHAHIDHAGLLPKLYRDGFRGRVYCTPATRDLSALMLMDSAHIQEKDAEYVNRKREKRGEAPVEPLYTQEDTEHVLRRFVSVPYGEPFAPLPGVRCVFRDAGHILGSATVNLEIQDGDRTVRLGFTGDVGGSGRPILEDPEPMDACDYVITESTYGGTVHEPVATTEDRLVEIVSRTVKRGGKVIVPAFAVGRTQELVYAMDRLANEGRLPRVPVYVDSPLAVNATSVYLAHPECFDAELVEYMRTDPNPLGFEGLTYVRDAESSKALNDIAHPIVIVSASGMAEAGRILHHLKNNVEDPRATVLIVGYCAEGTLGRRLAERAPVVRIFGEEYERKADVEVMDSLSAHADEPGLLAFLSHLDRERLRTTFLVHGDPERQQAFKATLKQHGWGEVTIPSHGQKVTLE
ncbi:MAG TPA: MBL fold metallo-hydrolase [Rhodothermales bacterium]|nr:MBL fold metallo-hydrolase [Rhodothermales bacterium]